jgi:hypothetical protein
VIRPKDLAKSVITSEQLKSLRCGKGGIQYCWRENAYVRGPFPTIKAAELDAIKNAETEDWVIMAAVFPTVSEYAEIPIADILFRAMSNAIYNGFDNRGLNLFMLESECGLSELTDFFGKWLDENVIVTAFTVCQIPPEMEPWKESDRCAWEKFPKRKRSKK